MKRGGPIKRRTPLKPYSKKRKATQTARRELVKRILAERPYCQAGPRIRDPKHRCQSYSTDCHEPLTRARGGDILDPNNILAVCRACHDWIHRNPAEATRLDLLASAYSPPYTPDT
jgi:hypothetical protein